MSRTFKKIFSIILVIGFAASLIIYPWWYGRQIDKLRALVLVHKGDAAYKKFKLQKAINCYNKALRLYPEHYSAWFNLGNIYVVYEDYYSAVDAYERAIQYNSRYIVARMNYGIVSAEKLGDFDGAISQYKAILDTKRHLLYIPFVFNNFFSYKANKGLAYYNMGIAYRQKSIFLNDDYDMQHVYLREAIESYQKSVKILKKDYDARYNLALAYHLNGDYNDAGLTYCKAIELEPMSYEAHYNLAILLKHLKYYKESLDEMEKATTLVTSSDGISNRQRYVFDVMNDITRIVMEDESSPNYLVEKLSNDPVNKIGLTYVHGKLVASDELDKAILKNFKTCGSKTIFLDNEDDENSY